MSFAHRALASFIGPALSLGVGLSLQQAAGSVLAAGPASSPSQSVAPSRPALGFIVQLKEQAHELPQSTEAGRYQRGERLARLARAAGYPSSLPWVSNGDALLHTRVPTRLTHDQAQKVIRKLLDSGEVAWAEPDVMQQLHQAVPATALPNDRHVSDFRQWWMRDVDLSSNPKRAGLPNLTSAWALHRGADSNQVVIAVLDTGIVSASTEFSGRLLPGYDFVSEVEYDRDSEPGRDANPEDPGDWLTLEERSGSALLRQDGCKVQDSSWHGTEVASVIGATADNGEGIAGVHWRARILPIRVSGTCGAALSDIIDAMWWAGGIAGQCQSGSGYQCSQPPVANANPAKVINISFGGDGLCGPAYQTVIHALRAAGVLVVASAGNTQGVVTRPANCSGVVSVAALNRTGLKANYSGFGPAVTLSTIGGDASGGNWDAWLGDGGMYVMGNDGLTGAGPDKYHYMQGTSFAAPIVSAVAALMWELHPTFNVQDIVDGLQRSVRPHVISGKVAACSSDNPGRCMCTTSTCGVGILDAKRALQYAGASTPDPYFALHPALDPEDIDTSSVLAAAASGPDDPPLTPPTSTKSGGGGGALDGLALLALAAAGMLRPLCSRRKPAASGFKAGRP